MNLSPPIIYFSNVWCQTFRILQLFIYCLCQNRMWKCLIAFSEARFINSLFLQINSCIFFVKTRYILWSDVFPRRQRVKNEMCLFLYYEKHVPFSPKLGIPIKDKTWLCRLDVYFYCLVTDCLKKWNKNSCSQNWLSDLEIH